MNYPNPTRRSRLRAAVPLALLLALAAAAPRAHAQDCAFAYPIRTGVNYTLANFNAKDKPEGTTTFEVVEGDGQRGRLRMTATDARGRTADPVEYAIQCQGGNFQVDMSGMTRTAGQNYEVRGTASAFIQYPSNMAVGQSLPDGSFAGKIIMNGSETGEMNLRVSNRKVVAQQSVTVPVGTFNAYVITYDMRLENKIGPIAVPFQFSVKEWYAQGVGMVRSETYNKNGKLQVYTVLQEAP